MIAGTFKGRHLVAPKGNRLVRPTTDRVKESVFSILQERVVDANFLDLCAGTGNIGIEALSRGAKHVTFLDREPRCIAVIKKNLHICGLTTESQMYALLRRDVLKGIVSLHKRAVVFEVIYFDPPYGVGLGNGSQDPLELYTTSLALLAETTLLKIGGVLLVEHARQTDMPDAVGNLCRNRQAHYGDTVVSFYQSENRNENLESPIRNTLPDGQR
ncbi:MAG: 16S rRNA (guanine(966)-N(2))-methyltransferase RsmD [Candidatus Poribacteria bacterium]|nr:16S rRNA (guanine(966)-N(2))-methyltransferase RsmD [Candidatus Poribacteria bacterium]